MAFKIGHGKNDPTQAKSSFRWPSCRLSERKLIVAKSIIHTLHFCEIPNVCNFTQQYPNCVMLWNGSGQNRLYIIYIYNIFSKIGFKAWNLHPWTQWTVVGSTPCLKTTVLASNFLFGSKPAEFELFSLPALWNGFKNLVRTRCFTMFYIRF